MVNRCSLCVSEAVAHGSAGCSFVVPRYCFVLVLRDVLWSVVMCCALLVCILVCCFFVLINGTCHIPGPPTALRTCSGGHGAYLWQMCYLCEKLSIELTLGCAQCVWIQFAQYLQPPVPCIVTILLQVPHLCSLATETPCEEARLCHVVNVFHDWWHHGRSPGMLQRKMIEPRNAASSSVAVFHVRSHRIIAGPV